MKRILIIVSAILAVLVIAALVVPFLVPKSVYKAQIEKAATSALQRDVALTGDVSISVFPRISARVGGVTVANPEGFAQPNMIEAGELRGSVKWLPLLSRRVDVQELAFVDANVFLQRLEDGRGNWEIGSSEASEQDGSGSGGGFDAGIASAVLKNASLTFQDDQAGKTYAVTEFDLDASMQALNQPLKADASGLFQGQSFDMELRLDSPDALTSEQPATVLLDMETSLGKVQYDGIAQLGEPGALDGDLSFSAKDLAALTSFLGVDMPYNLAPLGAANVKAKVSGALTSPDIRFDVLSLKGDLIDASFSGAVKLAEMPELNGTLTADLPNAGELTRQLGMELPAADALERVQISGDLSGAVDALSLTGIDAKHSGALLNASYTGDASLAGDGRLNGQMSASSDSLRALLAATGTELAPGETLREFDVSGDLSGTLKAFTIGNLDLTLDDLSGRGNAGLNLAGTTPKLTGDLTMQALDLTPFMGESSSGSSGSNAGIQPWSKEPLDLAGLKAVNADLKLNAGTVTVGNVKLSDAVIATTLQDGRLVADLSQFNAFNGAWKGNLLLNAETGTPTLSFDMTGDNVLMSSLLGTLSGFDKLTGTGQFRIKANASGNSIDEIMHSFDGDMSTALAEGSIKGFNVLQLVRSASSLREALTSGNIQSLDFASALSPAAETDFSSFETVLTVRDGVASVDLMKLLSPVLGIDGSGTINLGGQSLDLRLATSIDKKAQGQGSVVQLNGIPVPVRLSGSWNNLKVSPDMSGVRAALQAELGGRLIDQLGGSNEDGTRSDAGNIIGDIIGVPRNETPATPETPADQDAQEPPKTTEEQVEDAARDALKDLFGRKKKEEDDGGN